MSDDQNATEDIGPTTDTEAAPELPEFGSIDGAAVLVAVRAFLARHIVADGDDLSLLTLWIAHTWLARELRVTPRLLLYSIVPGSGKTTALEHLDHLCLNPLLAATITEATIPRLLHKQIRTVLLDEVQRTLRSDLPGVEDIMTIVNNGYRVGAVKPVIEQRGKKWDVVELEIFAPVAMAGNSPYLPQDTLDRTLQVLLMPDGDGEAEDSDWEGGLDEEAKELSDQLSQWADSVRGHISEVPGELPKGAVGRFREKWRSLRRVAELAEFHNGENDWKGLVYKMAAADLEEAEEERRAGLRQQPPGLVLMCDLYRFWPEGEDGAPKEFVATEDLVEVLIKGNPGYWDVSIDPPRHRLGSIRLGRMIRQAIRSTSRRPGGGGTPRGYNRSQFERAWKRLRVAELIEATSAGG